jgi:predicted amidophosphoribosyltransferase
MVELSEDLTERVQHLENMVIQLSERNDQSLLESAGQQMQAGVQAWKEQAAIIPALLARIEKLERQCQGLADRPMNRNCSHCGKRADAIATHCPACGKAMPR